MKEKIKVFAQKCCFWMCVLLGIVVTLVFLAGGASYFIPELDFMNAAVFSIVPMVATFFYLQSKKEKMISEMYIDIEQKKFFVCCMGWIFRAVIMTMFVIVICVLIGVLYLLLWYLCAKGVEFLIGKNILHSKITILVMLMGYASLVYTLFQKE